MTMLRVRVGVVVMLALALLAGSWWIGVNRADDKPPRRQYMPYGWSQLKGEYKVSKEQRQRALKIRADYRAQRDELQAKIDKLESQEREELFKVLTPAQKEQLAKLLIGGGTKTEAKPKESEKPKGTDKLKGKAKDK
jgi:flagellar basal body-associated protein FliL